MLTSRRRLLAMAVAQLAVSATQIASAQGGDASLFDRILRTRDARVAGDAQGWYEWGRSTLELAPDHPDLMISVARAAAATGHHEEAYRLLADAALRGAGFDVQRFAELGALDFTGLNAETADRARANLAPIARAEHFVDLPASQCEGVAYDARTQRCFVGAGDGRIFALFEQGAVSTFVEGLEQVLGVKVDPRRRLLWAVSGRFPNLLPPPDQAQSAEAGRTGVRAFNADSGAPVGAWNLDERPTLHGFNDMALARNGDVYITDSPTGSIYKLSGGGELDRFVQSPTLSFLNGIVMAPNQRRLYVAHTEGLSAIDLERKTIRKLGLPNDASVHGIDGMAWLGRDLIGVQGSPYFARIARIALDQRGENVVRVSTLNARTPREYQQTTCAVVGDYVVAVGGSPAADPYGGPPRAAEPRPHLVRIAV